MSIAPAAPQLTPSPTSDTNPLRFSRWQYPELIDEPPLS